MSYKPRTSFLKAVAQAFAAIVLMTISIRLLATDFTGLLNRMSTIVTGAHVEVAKRVAEFKDTFTIGGLAFSPDGSQLVTSGMLGPPELHIWHWKGGSGRFQALAMTLTPGSSKGVTYSPDGALLAAVHAPNQALQGSPPPIPAIQVWDAHNWKVTQDVATERKDGEISDIAFTGNGKLLVALQQKIPGSYVTAFETKTWKRAWDIDVGVKGFDAGTFAISPDDHLIAIGGRTFALRSPTEHKALTVVHPVLAIVDLATRKVVRIVTSPFPDDNEIQTLAWSADGRQIAAGATVGGSENGTALGPDTVRIFDASSGTQLISEKADAAYVSGLAYTGDGRYLVEGTVDAGIRIWDGHHGTLYQSIPVDWHARIFLAISKDGKYLAVGADRKLSVFELK